MKRFNRYLACLIPALGMGSFVDAATPDDFAPHPSADDLARVFSEKQPNFHKTTGLKKADYLKLIASNVDHFVKFQNEQGAIIDPYRKQETQYSTPAFALAAGALVKNAGRSDLLDPAVKALSRSITDLSSGKTADGHSDFYIPLIIHAHRMLKDIAPPLAADQWQVQISGLNCEKIYNARLRTMNWNIVSSSGELLRRKDDLVANSMKAAQWDYLENCLKGHADSFSGSGLYKDPNFPMAYDAFSRFFLEDMLADGAYDGKYADELRKNLKNAELTTLMLLSPIGEWPSGGRSALHNWNEAQIVAICEMAANNWNKSSPQVAGAFKHAARLALSSMQRWTRDTGELYIVKNRFEPTERMGFESYSHHSQYNLLPMAMLAVAYERANDEIEETPTPAELGGYVLDLREDFHKIVAAAGGYYLLIDSNADPKYNATGIQRIHKAGVPFPFINDSVAGQRDYAPANAPKTPLSPGIVWIDDAGKSSSLSDMKIQKADLQVHAQKPGQATFTLKYTFAGNDSLTQTYSLSTFGVQCTETVNSAIVSFQVPALVDDGKEKPAVQSGNGRVSVAHRGGKFTLELQTDAPGAFELQAPETVNHMGKIRPMVCPINSKPHDLSWVITME